MASKELPLLSAQVVLQSASGRSIRGGAAITAETLRDYEPSKEAVAAARDAFADLGFDVGPFVGVSFSISAPASTFERVFGAAPGDSPAHGQGERRGPARATAAATRSQDEQELAITGLPEHLQAIVESVTVPPSPSFGPGGGY